MNSVERLRTIAAKTRGFKMLSALNHKSIKGEASGYLTAMLYLAPERVAGGKSLCPYSTPACRDGCLNTAGRGRMPTIQRARIRRARMYLNERDRFFDELIGELACTQDLADQHGLTMAIRLNGTADIAFERERVDGRTLFELFPRARWYDFTRIPTRHRSVPDGWHLTWSLADGTAQDALNHLFAIRSVAAIVPTEDRESAPDWFMVAGRSVMVIDGEEDDLRFLDPPGALVLLRPKGRLAQFSGSPMVHHGLIAALIKLGANS